MNREPRHPPQQRLSQLAQIDGIEKKILRVRRDIDFINPGGRPQQEDALRAERMG